ncbi:hypothetical protein FSP39_002559 [Pinctada imbricata]|uniref:Poly(A)-specific ribonuclease PARN n=1 Tax=Pinctada imbricata TaxID=66713 RepID=A0AA89BPL3_PINIB|nr:hypothetical protein FSP39_002559 [Pinctada imbricata]
MSDALWNEPKRHSWPSLHCNFKDVFSVIETTIEDACFLAIDGEFTGLEVGSGSVASFDTPEDRYHKVRQASCDFLLVQFGLCAFKYNKETKQYEARPFNFYLFPRPYMRGAPDCRFLCQSSSLDFLASQGFDFNKVFREGISYLRQTDESYIRETINIKHQACNQFSSPAFFSPDGNEPTGSKGPIVITDEHKEFIEGILKSVSDFMENKESETLELPKCNGFQRKLIYQVVRQKFTSGIHLESKTGEKKQRYIVVSKVKSEDELKKKEEEKQKNEMQELDDAIGFTKVINMISKSGKLVIGHNMFLDLLHTLHQFCAPLPDDYEEFKSLTNCIFPKILDTKLMASTNPFKEQIISTALGDLHNIVSAKPFSKAEVVMPEDFAQYQINENNLHEAGYDAYITGRCFISMANYLGSFHKPPMSRVAPTSPLVEPFINKLFMMRILDIPYMNLAGKDCSIHVGWINDTSAYVTLQRKEESKKVIKSLNKKGALHRVISYEQSKSSESKHNAENGTRKRQHQQSSDPEPPQKKQKPLNANAPPFVSRSITPPVSDAPDPPDTTTEKPNENKMFEEPTSW